LASAPPVLVFFARFFDPSDAVELFDRYEFPVEVVGRKLFEGVESENFLLLEILKDFL